MHRRAYLPDSHNHANLMGRRKIKAERDAAILRAERAEREADAAMQRATKAKAENTSPVGAFVSKLKKFLTRKVW